MPRTYKDINSLTRAMRRQVRQIEDHLVRKLKVVGDDAIARSRQTRTYKDQTGRAIKNHFAEVVSSGQSKTVTFRRADESTFDVTLESQKATADLYFGNLMQYTVWVERLHNFNVVQQEIPNIRQQLPAELASGLKIR